MDHTNSENIKRCSTANSNLQIQNSGHCIRKAITHLIAPKLQFQLQTFFSNFYWLADSYETIQINFYFFFAQSFKELEERRRNFTWIFIIILGKQIRDWMCPQDKFLDNVFMIKKWWIKVKRNKSKVEVRMSNNWIWVNLFEKRHVEVRILLPIFVLHASAVVYFDQWMGAPHAVRWSK